ncbi:MAG TPA: hypothetical protein ENG12_04390 [Candidatus Altiarchaeales archaeon]|nr:hypothetical protein [Candidatus Altiarchaeales archaeon]
MEKDGMRRKVDRIIMYLGYYLELYLGYIRDYCRTEPRKAITIGAVILILITMVAVCISHKPEKEIEPIITSEEQAIMIAKREFKYGDVKSVHLSNDMWLVEMELPLPVVVPEFMPYSNKTTKRLIVCINSTSGDVVTILPRYDIT